MATILNIGIPSGRQQHVTLNPIKKDGTAASIDGAAKYVSSDETILKVVPDTSGNGANIQAIGTSGQTATITVTGDADLGSGVDTIETDIDVTITDAEADDLGVAVDGGTTDIPAATN